MLPSYLLYSWEFIPFLAVPIIFRECPKMLRQPANSRPISYGTSGSDRGLFITVYIAISLGKPLSVSVTLLTSRQIVLLGVIYAISFATRSLSWVSRSGFMTISPMAIKPLLDTLGSTQRLLIARREVQLCVKKADVYPFISSIDVSP